MNKEKLIELLSAAQERQAQTGRVFKDDYQDIFNCLGISREISVTDNPIHIGAVIQLEICKLMLKGD